MKALFPFLAIIILLACEQGPKSLPIMGPREVEVHMVDGEEVIDTIYKTVPDFQFTNQDGETYGMKNLDGKIYVTDFFFTTCPTICPLMKSQMLRIHEKFKDNNDFHIVSHSIDPKHDTVEVLHAYADRLGVDTKHWTFLTGDMDAIFDMAQKHYLVSAMEDSLAPGGLLHSGAFILVDKERRVRGYYDGTVEEDVNLLIKDASALLQSYEKK